MMRSLFSAVSGLKTHQTRMDVIGNNIANVNTEAFKASSVRFSELMYQTMSTASGGDASTGTGGVNAKQVGLGVSTASTMINITGAGSSETTGYPFDLKLSDSQTTNFFIVSDGTNTMFTRAGSFYVDGNGYLCMSSTGYTVQGWQVDKTTGEIHHQDNRFGELAIQLGYLTEAQVEELLKQQTPAFLSLGQVLLDEGVLTNTDFEQIIQDYRSKNGMEDEESLIERRKNIQQLFENFFSSTDAALSEKGHMFIELLFNDFIRFIGSDYTPLSVEEVTEASIACCVKQEIHGDYAINTYISMDLDTAIAFATRYVHEQFHSYDEYVQASLEDFLNLQNGLFIVNVSNTSNTELTLGAPEHITVSPIQFSGRTLHIPVLYTFGTIDFYMERVSIKE